jgi:predicted GIY-YIG superfamily endonuclease
MPKRKLPRPGQPGEVYLIHLNQPIGHARHYTGFALDHARRFQEHLDGRGGRLLKVANSRGITYAVVRVWSPADRRFERRVKNSSRAPQLCPVCNPATWATNLPVVNDAVRRKSQSPGQNRNRAGRKNDYGKTPSPA